MSTERRGAVAILVAAVFGALLFAALTRNLLQHVPTYDELLHVLAARGVVATGEPVMGAGEYRRAELYTRAVAFAYEHHGDSLISARLPSWFSGIALVALIGGWVARRRGLLAGMASASVLAATPILYETAVLARFYSMHALASVAALIALYEALASGRTLLKRFALCALAAALLAIAWHLQISTVIVIGAGLAGLLAIAIDYRWNRLTEWAVRHQGAALSGIAGMLAIAALVAWQLGSYLLHWLGDAPLWAENGTRIDFYARVLREQLPLLGPLLPVAAVITFFIDRRLAVFCLAVALAGFAAHSIAPFKASRYVLYLMPFLAVVWGCALAASIVALASAVRGFTRWSAPAAWLCAFAGIGLVLANSVEGVRGAKLLLGKARLQDVLSYVNEGDWKGAAGVLAPLQAKAQTLIASSGVKALYSLGDYDYELNASVVPESEGGREFGRDERTGRQVIGTVESLRRVLDEPGRALVVADQEKVGDPAGIAPPVAELLLSRCTAVPGLDRFRVAGWSCN